jgi:hypothetical protein
VTFACSRNRSEGRRDVAGAVRSSPEEMYLEHGVSARSTAHAAWSTRARYEFPDEQLSFATHVTVSFDPFDGGTLLTLVDRGYRPTSSGRATRAAGRISSMGSSAVMSRAGRRECAGLAVLALPTLLASMDLTVFAARGAASVRRSATKRHSAVVDHRHRIDEISCPVGTLQIRERTGPPAWTSRASS